MKKFTFAVTALVLILVTIAATVPRTPLNNAFLQSDLNGNTKKITNAAYFGDGAGLTNVAGLGYTALNKAGDNGGNLTNLNGGAVTGAVALATLATTASSANAVSASVSNAFLKSTDALYGSNVVGAVAQCTHATNADLATLATTATDAGNVILATLTNKTYGSNLVGAAAQATHATNADSATTATSATSATAATTASFVAQSPLTNAVTNLPTTGTAGTYTKVTFDAQGRETSGTTLSASDIPAIAESGVTGLVSDLAAKLTQSSSLNASNVTGTLANNTSGNAATATVATTVTQSPLTNAVTNYSGTLPAAQLPALTGAITSSAGSVATSFAMDVVTNGRTTALSISNSLSVVTPSNVTAFAVGTNAQTSIVVANTGSLTNTNNIQTATLKVTGISTLTGGITGNGNVLVTDSTITAGNLELYSSFANAQARTISGRQMTISANNSTSYGIIAGAGFALRLSQVAAGSDQGNNANTTALFDNPSAGNWRFNTNVFVGGTTTSSNGFNVGNTATFNVDGSGNITNSGTHQVGTLKATTSVSPDSGAIKHQRITTGSVSGGSTALVTVTWTTAFSDSNYTVQASVQDSTATSLSLSVVHIESVSASAVTVRVLNNAVSAITGTLHIAAFHD